MISTRALSLMASLTIAAAASTQTGTGVETLLNEGRNIEAYELAVRTNSSASNVTSLFWLGEAARRTGRDEEAARAFEKALSAQPGYLDALLGLGAVYERQENWPKALEYYLRAATLHPQHPMAFARMGDVYRKNGTWDKAAEQYRRAVALAPDDARLKNLLQACQHAVEEQRGGVVKAATFLSLAQLAANRSGASETTYRGLKAKPDPAPSVGEEGRIPVHISFPRDKSAVADLADLARKQLDEVASVLQSPEWKARRPVIVEGHACTCGPAAFNLTLGRKRAEAIREFLIEKKVLRPEDATATSLGKSNPIAIPAQENLDYQACQRDDAHNQNRRVIIKEARQGAAARVSFWYRPSTGGETRPLTNGAALRTGDEVKIQVQTYDQMYAYVFHHGSANDWSVLFPRKQTARALPGNPLQPGKPRWIPDSDASFVLDQVPGTEETLVFLSPGPDPVLDNLVDRLTQAPRPALPAKQKTPAPASGTGANTPPPTDEDPPAVVSHLIKTRGLQGVKASKVGDVFLNLRSFASVKFEHIR